MNKNLEKMLSKVAKPVAKVMLPLALTFGAYQGVNAQDYRANIASNYVGTFIVLNEQERTLRVDETVSPFNSHITENVPYTLDVLTVKALPNEKTFTILYPGDLTWNKGDSIIVKYSVHKDGSRKWTDEELVKNKYLNIVGLHGASNPSNAGFYDAIITELRDVKPGKQE